MNNDRQLLDLMPVSDRMASIIDDYLRREVPEHKRAEAREIAAVALDFVRLFEDMAFALAKIANKP